MSKTRMYVDYLDGTKSIVDITAGDKVRAQRAGNPVGSPEYNLLIVWSAAKRNHLPGTDDKVSEQEAGEGSVDQHKMFAWLDTVEDYDLLITQDMVDELKAAGNVEAAENMQKFVREDTRTPGE